MSEHDVMHLLDSATGLWWAMLGTVGGLAKVLVQLLALNELPTTRKIVWLLGANMLVSGFSGFLGAVVMSSLTPNDNLHVVAAGVFGYMGVAGLDYLAERMKSKIT